MCGDDKIGRIVWALGEYFPLLLLRTKKRNSDYKNELSPLFDHKPPDRLKNTHIDQKKLLIYTHYLHNQLPFQLKPPVSTKKKNSCLHHQPPRLDNTDAPWMAAGLVILSGFTCLHKLKKVCLMDLHAYRT